MRIIETAFGSTLHKNAMQNRRLDGKPYLGASDMSDWIASNLVDLSDCIFLFLKDSIGTVRTSIVFGTFPDEGDAMLYRMVWK